MVKTIRIIDEKQRALIDRHSSLSDIELVSLSKSNIGFQELSDLIETCWTHDYEDETRIVFSPQFLKWIMPEPIGVVGLIGGQPKAAVISIPMLYTNNGKQGKFALETGLSCLPSHRGSGIGQYVCLEGQRVLIEKDYDFSVSWIDLRHNHKGSSYSLYGKKGNKFVEAYSFPIMGKSFDFRKSLEYADLDFIIRQVARLVNTAFPILRKPFNIPGYSIQEFNKNHIDCYRDLFQRSISHTNIKRSFSDKEISRKLDYNDDALDTRSFFLYRGDEPVGIVFGYSVPLRADDAFFFYDGIIFDKGVPYRIKKEFLLSCEGELREDSRCIGATAVTPTCSENLVKYGYLPINSQILGIDQFKSIDIRKNDLNSLFIELR